MFTTTMQACAAAAIVCSAAVTLAEPEVFSDAGYEADGVAAVEQDRLHLVYATASWCPPCQRMKKTTWIDESVESWVEQHGIVTALDVDEFPEIAGDLGVRAMPTMILFEGGEELGRRTGYASADDLVGWMEAGRSGEAMPGPAGMDWEDDGEDTVRPKLNAAKELLNTGQYDEATTAYIDLWENMLDEERSYYGVRLSFMVGEMFELAAEHEPAKRAFTEIRDREAAKLKAGDVDWDTLTDWVHLNQVVEDYNATIEWVERVSKRANSGSTLNRFADEITEQASKIRRWDIVAMAVRNPVAEAREQLQFIDMMREWTEDDITEDPNALAWHLKPAIIAALHAGDDGSKERALVEYFETAFDDSDAWRVTFIHFADQCGKLRDDHVAWSSEFNLDERYPEGIWVEQPDF